MLLAVFSLHAALACGGFVPTAGALAASDAQQALFDLGADAITVTYRARYAGDAADFAWVLAVPGRITTVAEGDNGRLESITTASAPQVEIDPAIDAGGPGCGCAQSNDLAGRSKGDGDFGADTGVTVTGSGFAGDFTYTTLAASDADSLAAWLTDNGYDIAAIEPAIADYVADPLGYEWVAVQLRPEVAATPDTGVQLDALAITYGAAADGELHALFPAKLGRSSTVEEVRTEIMVLGAGTATLGGGWTAEENPAETDDRPFDLVGPDYVEPTGVYTNYLRTLGGDTRTMWLAYAGGYSDGGAARWLTRFDAIVAPGTNVVDPVLTDSGVESTAATVIYVMDETAFQASYDTGAWLVPLGLLAGVGLRRRRGV